MSRPTLETGPHTRAWPMRRKRAALVPQVYSLLELLRNRASAAAVANTP